MMNATLSSAAPRTSMPRQKKRLWLIACGLIFLLAAGSAFYFIRAHWPYRYREIKPMLESDLAAQVTITTYHRTYFPNPGFVATGLTLHRKSALNLPPIGHIDQMIVQSRWRDLLMLRKRVQTIDVTGLHLIIPPVGSKANQQNFPPGSSSDFTGPDTSIAVFKFHNALLEIMKNDGSRLLFPIHELDFTNVEKNKASDYALDMQNAIPSGQIFAKGAFGPLHAKDLSSTPLSGVFTYTSVNLGDIGDIGGTLSSSGKFWGTLGAIEAEAFTKTPDFAVNDGKATLVTGSVHCTVNGLSGDVVLHSIDATTGKTNIHASGTVQGAPKITNLDIDVKSGRAQDLMRPFIKGQVPVTGPVWLHAHAILAPSSGHDDFLHRLHVLGSFDVPAERVSNPQTEKSLTDFSNRAQDKNVPDLNESTDRNSRGEPTDALSSVKGPVEIRDGVASSKRIIFQVPGAQADLNGTFAFHGSVVHLVGNLSMESDISHATTGFKSFFLKPLAPFFKKKNKGAVVPVAVTGNPGHYQVTQDLSHTK
jgi:hypothetical protein